MFKFKRFIMVTTLQIIGKKPQISNIENKHYIYNIYNIILIEFDYINFPLIV